MYNLKDKMKSLLYIGLYMCCLVGHAQEKTILLSDSMFNATGGLDFSDLDGWVFHPGCDADLASKDVNTREWKALKPSQLSTDYINLFGRACGWFRIKVKLDSSLASKPIGLMNRSWMATDLYVDGDCVQSFGSTGYLGMEFADNKKNTIVPLLINLQVDSTYILALRVVDQRPISPEELASPKLFKEWRRSLFLSNTVYVDHTFNHHISKTFHDGLTIAVTTVLSLLFWMIYLLNRSEKNIRRFAVGSSLLALITISLYIKEVQHIPFLSFAIFQIFALLCIIAFICYIPYILAGVFNKTIPRWVNVAVIILFIAMFTMLYLDQDILFITVALLPIGFSLYYLFFFIRNLSRAQLSIVIGFSISVIFIIIFLINSAGDYIASLKYSIIYTVASPLGMLGYVAFRFREMIVETRTSAEEVLRLSEERREQAVSEQKRLEEEVERQTADLRNTLSNLKATQAQLVQSEKMASLGELTAGIAHEIQNPLNFVNNFSEVSKELLDEMKTELEAENTEDAKEIADDVIQNLEKIVHHGKRADSIVKGMLQHSRSGSGQKELTDVSALADEYLRLAYHGLRAKDKTFNATLETDYDEAIGKLDIMPQDMGRVILNLITNAFHAAADKKKTLGSDFMPAVSVTTKKENDMVFISVRDNGKGIPAHLREKIFQPFFTTKPTGEGTGLGLSLAYDIVKAHSGDLEVETKEGKGTTFTIVLPLTLG